MKFLPLILKNLARNKRRTFLTVLSVAVSLFIFAALMSLPGVVDQILRDPANSLRLICHGKAGFFYPLPDSYTRRISAVPRVEAVIGENIFMGTYLGPQDQVRSVAVDPDQIEEMWPDFGITHAAAQQFGRLRTAALVGKGLMKRYRWRVGDQVMLRGTIYPVDIQLNIVGTLGGMAAASALFFRRDYLQSSLGELGYAHLFWIKVDSSRSVPGVIAQIDGMFANSAAETETESEVALARGQLANLHVIFDGVKALAAIVIVTIGLVAANTTAMSVRERRPEIGVMRAIGFSRGAIVACIVAEGALVAIAGGLIGCGLAYLALRMIPYASAALGPLVAILSLPRRVFVESMMVAAALGLCASLVPALAATHRNISDSLRAA